MREVVLAAVASCAFAGGCSRATPPVADAAPSASAQVPDARPPPAPTVDIVAARRNDPANPRARVPCRAVAVDGDVHAEDVPRPGTAHGARDGDGGALGLALAKDAEIPQDAWLSLGKSARLIAKDPRTTRETTLLGPGRGRICVGRREEAWVASGAFESVVGAGETPGAEEWVFTPAGVVRYAVAKVRAEVRAKETSVTLASGTAFLWPADDVQVGRKAAGAGVKGAGAGDAGADASAAASEDEGWTRLAEGETAVAAWKAGAPAPLDGARAATDRCGVLADRSRDLAALLVAPSVGLPDASTAAEQVTARRLARAACGVAALRVDTLAPSPAHEALSVRLKDAMAAWTALPASPGPVAP